MVIISSPYQLVVFLTLLVGVGMSEMPVSPAADNYVVIPYSLDLPAIHRAKWASCSFRSSAQTPPFGELFRDTSWTDATAIVAAAVTAKGFHQLNPSLQKWCKANGKTGSIVDCLAAAVTSTRATSPLFHLSLLYCSRIQVLQPMLDLIDSPDNDYVWPDRLVIYGASHVYDVGDKTGVFVKLLPSLPPHQRREAFKYAPRGYLISLDCAGPRKDDQWNLFLEDFYDGDEAAMAAVKRSSPSDFRVTEDDSWREKQSIDQGKHMWVSKPGMGSTFSIFEGGALLDLAKANMHFGNNIKVFFSPQEFLDITKEEGRTDKCASEYRVIQKYVERPLLWAGHKSDHRLWVVTVSVDPPVHYMYMGLITARVSRFPYEERSIDQPIVADTKVQDGTFVTNQHMSLAEADVDNVHMWVDFVAYLQTVNPHIPNIRDFLEQRLIDLAAAVLPIVTELKHDKKAIAVSAWDVGFDEDFQPWLLEMNNAFDMTHGRVRDCIYPLVGQALALGLRDDVRGPNPPAFVQDFRLVPMNP